MNHDQIQKIGNSLIQHGHANDRIYLMKLAQNDVSGIIPKLTQLAQNQGYSKIFAKIPAYAKDHFLQNGFQVEASVPRFYQAQEAAYFMGRYFHPQRQNEEQKNRINNVLKEARLKADSTPAAQPSAGLSCRLAEAPDCTQMAQLYQKVFSSYPFPIHDPAYLLKTMADNVIYAGVWLKDELLALASAEIDHQGKNAEMTDFATQPDCQGQGLANTLMTYLEKEMIHHSIITCYTIARAISYGMNICFSRNGYRYSGTLTKNTQISGALESMNVWYKHL